RIEPAREQQPAAVLDDPGVVPGCERVCPGAVREGEQPGETEATVAVDARVRRLATLVTAYEWIHPGAANLVAQIERHVRNAERITRRPCSKDGVGRAAGALRVGTVRIEPEPQRDT